MLGQYAREELAGVVVAELRDAARIPAERRNPRGDVRRLTACAGACLRAHVVAGGERLVEPHDHVEHHVAEGCDTHSYNHRPWMKRLGCGVRVRS